jgi:hypothetical protein
MSPSTGRNIFAHGNAAPKNTVSDPDYRDESFNSAAIAADRTSTRA